MDNGKAVHMEKENVEPEVCQVILKKEKYCADGACLAGNTEGATRCWKCDGTEFKVMKEECVAATKLHIQPWPSIFGAMGPGLPPAA